MSTFIPYVVLAVVVLGFFGVCYAVFNKSESSSEAHSVKSKPSKKTRPGRLYEQEKVHITPRETHDGVDVYEAHVNESIPVGTDTIKLHNPVEQHDLENYVTAEPIVTEPTVTEPVVAEPVVAEPIDAATDTEKTMEIPVVESSTEDTIALGESPDVMDETRCFDADATQMFGSENSEVVNPQGPSALEETRMFNADEINEHLSNIEEDEPEPIGPWAQAAQEDKRVALAIEPFAHAFGVVHGDAMQFVADITRDALAVLGITKLSEVKLLLQNIVIQEALLAMQKAYAGTPTTWMKTAALEAFSDVVQSPKSSTPYLVAFDALRVLPHLTLGHFQVMALTLLLQYSRNSNNYGRIHFQHYVEKYIEPFISDLPHDSSFYRQLDYLRCTQQERESVTLTQLLSNSYPFVFNYRGFTKEELFRATDGRGVDPRFFREARISDPMVQRDLMALMKSKPTAFRGEEARQIMDDISPVLSDLARVYDESPMCSISLTLLGLYLGRAHVKATIGEEFDLSHWF